MGKVWLWDFSFQIPGPIRNNIHEQVTIFKYPTNKASDQLEKFNPFPNEAILVSVQIYT